MVNKSTWLSEEALIAGTGMSSLMNSTYMNMQYQTISPLMFTGIILWILDPFGAETELFWDSYVDTTIADSGSLCLQFKHEYPDSKVHGAKMGPIWVLSPQMGPMLAPWTLLWGYAGYKGHWLYTRKDSK